MKRTKEHASHATLLLHNYQPPRTVSHHRLSNIHTDPRKYDWTRQITNESYIPQIEMGILDKASFDMYATLRVDLAKVPEFKAGSLEKLREAMAKNGVGDTYIHALLPNLPEIDKMILLHAGRIAFQRDAGVSPSWLWLAETGIDTATIKAVQQAGYLGIIVSPEQVYSLNPAQHNWPLYLLTVPASDCLA